jgi:hypothetical protein
VNGQEQAKKDKAKANSLTKEVKNRPGIVNGQEQAKRDKAKAKANSLTKEV